MTPANQVTAVRAAGAVACAALVALALTGRVPADSWWLALVAGPTLLLDLVDGKVARLAGTETAFGARFDMEVDAAMVAILSIHAAPVAPLALLVGAARYLLALGTWLRPQWRGPVTPRRFRKVVAATVAALLWVTTTPVTPTAIVWACVVASVALLAWSFGTQVLELERRAPAGRSLPREEVGHVSR